MDALEGMDRGMSLSESVYYAWNLYVVAVIDTYSCSQEESLKLHKDLPVECLETLSKNYMTKLFFLLMEPPCFERCGTSKYATWL